MKPTKLEDELNDERFTNLRDEINEVERTLSVARTFLYGVQESKTFKFHETFSTVTPILNKAHFLLTALLTDIEATRDERY